MSTPAVCRESFNYVYISLPTCEDYGALWLSVCLVPKRINRTILLPLGLDSFALKLLN